MTHDLGGRDWPWHVISWDDRTDGVQRRSGTDLNSTLITRWRRRFAGVDDYREYQPSTNWIANDLNELELMLKIQSLVTKQSHCLNGTRDGALLLFTEYQARLFRRSVGKRSESSFNGFETSVCQLVEFIVGSEIVSYFNADKLNYKWTPPQIVVILFNRLFEKSLAMYVSFIN